MVFIVIVDKKILNRGYDYYLDGAVDLLNKPGASNVKLKIWRRRNVKY
jgi:hypothetical protein